MIHPPAARAALPPHAPQGSLRLLGSLGVFTFLYGLCFVAIDAGIVFAPPLRFAALRALIAGGALFAVARARHEPLRVPRSRWPGLLLLAFLSTTVAFAAMFLTAGRTGPGIASVLGNLQPLYAVVLAAIFLGERVTPRKLLTLLLGGAGVFLIAYPTLASSGPSSTTGALLALAASGASAAGSVVVKRLPMRGALLTTAAWQLALGSLPLFVLSAIVERAEGVNWTAPFVAVLLFLALPGTAFTTFLWYWLLERNEMGRLSLFLFLVPAFGLAVAILAFGERVSATESAGVGLTLAAILAVLREPPGPPGSTAIDQ